MMPHAYANKHMMCIDMILCFIGAGETHHFR